MEISIEELPSVVTEGALFMDAIDSEWFWIVNPDILNMTSSRNCILGQHHPLGLLDTKAYGFQDDNIIMTALNLNHNLLGLVSLDLRRLWQDEINDRRVEWLEEKHASV